jgi:hypothetical protein
MDTNAIREAADRLDDLDWHLTRWTSPGQLAAHLDGPSHRQRVPAAEGDDMAALEARHGTAHALEINRARRDLDAAEDAAGIAAACGR